MSRIRLNNYLDSLHRQIDRSVANIKDRTAAGSLQPENFDAEADNRYNYSRVNSYAYNLLETGVSYQLVAYSSLNSAASSSAYAAGSYQNAKDVLKEPTVLIDYMFEYNREFNFKV